MAGRILVADDSPTVQKKASGILTGEGLQVVTVSNGVAAVKKLSSFKPLVILADVAMPGKDGYELCDFVKNSPDLGAVAVLLIFSDDDLFDEERSARVRADGKIKKPFNRDELIATVAKLVAQSEEAASKPAPASAVTAPAPPSVITEPMDEEPTYKAIKAGPDVSSLMGGTAFAEPSPEEVAAELPEPPPVEVESDLPPDAPPIAVEPAPVADEASPEAEPLPWEQPPAVAPPEPPPAERTVMFRAPADIAEPVLTDEASPTPWSLPSPPAEEKQGPGVQATTLESFSLKEAASGQVRFGTSDSESAVTEPATPAREVPRPLDAAEIFSIVHKVVVKMSPPALSPQTVEDIARRFADEITAELNSKPPRSF